MMKELITTVAYRLRNMVLLIVNYDGEWEDGQFNPKAVFFLSVTLKETLKTLGEKICSRFGLNCDEVEFKISTRIDGSIVEMIYDLDLQIFVSHNKENPKCYVSVFHKRLRSQVEQLSVPHLVHQTPATGTPIHMMTTVSTFGSTADQARTPPPMKKCKSTLSPVVSSPGYRSATGSNECVPNGSPVDDSFTPPSIRKSIFPQRPLATAGKKYANGRNHGGVNVVIDPLYSSGVLSSFDDKVVQSDFGNDGKLHCPTVLTGEEDGMGCPGNIKSSLCPWSNDIPPQDLPLHPRHDVDKDDNLLHIVDPLSLSAARINKNLSGPEHELKLLRRSGRLRKSIDKYNQESCSNFSEKGHNKSSCPKPAFDACRPTKPPRTCSICHKPGHNRQTCPSG